MGKKENPVIKYFENSRLPWIIAGVLFAIVSMVPFWILGEDSVITYHDQLDGELITYILNAKHLFDGSTNYLEVMNGIPKNGLVSPAPLFVFLFKFFAPFTAFMIAMAIVRLVSVVGMFVFLDELTGQKFISFSVACLFMLLPFYTVYGLCIPGQPILYYTFLRFRKDKWEWPLYFCIAFYAGCSSLALGGYAVLAVCLVAFVISLVKRDYPFRFLLVGAEIAVIFVCENISLVTQALGMGESFVSHKSEVVHSSLPFIKGVWHLITEGENYTEAFQKYYIPVVIIALVLGTFFVKNTAGEKKDIDRTYRHLWMALVSLTVTILLTAFIECPVVVNIINSRQGFLREFNFTRFSWLLTVMWFALLALSLKMLWLIAKNASYPVVGVSFYAILFVATMGATTFFAVYNNDIKPNVVKIYRHGDYYMMTWRQFYASDLFAEAEKKIIEDSGMADKSEYRVVSLGIYPAAASFNGFYTLDAYSNNYDVKYKHAFRRALAPELEKSEYLKNWYDNWGNRCYLVLAESMNYFTFEKRWTPYSTDYDLDFQALKDMGCEYILSASYLIDCEEHGLTLLNADETPIETEGSWYRLWVYKID